MPVKQFLINLTASKGFRAALPILLAGSFCVLLIQKPQNIASEGAIANLAGPGSFLLAGLPDRGLTYRMPLFGTVFSAALNLGATPVLFLAVVYFGIFALVFCAGCLLRGYWAGILSLAAAVFFMTRGEFVHDTEQAFYAFFLLLVLSLLLLKRRENTFRLNLLAGLAVGASMLVRTPLFLFPPALVFCDLLYFGERSRAAVLRSLVFLAASYILLVPWGALNSSITGKFDLFDNQNAGDNIITGALGSIYAMEGDSRRLAGIKEEDSSFNFYVRAAVKDPLFYAHTVARRLWHIFLFTPLLYGLFFAALLLNRERSLWPVFSLPAYFILVHALLSINPRYFYPMTYVLPPLIAGGFLRGRFGSAPEGGVFARKAVIFTFWLSFCAVLAVEALLIAYPRRAAKNIAGSGSFYAALDRFPNERVFQELKCKKLRDKGDDAGFYKCLGAYSEKFNDKVTAYFLLALESRSSAELAFPVADGEQGSAVTLKCFTIKMLREFELSDQAAAMASLRQAYSWYEVNANRFYGAPYEKDKELARIIKQDSARFWDSTVYDILLLWPPESAVKIFSGLEKNVRLSGKLRLLEYAVKNTPPPGRADRHAVEKNAFFGLASEILGPRTGSLRLLSEKAARRHPASEAYLRAVSSQAAAVSAGFPLRLHVSENELLQLLELADIKGGRQKLAAARSLKGRGGRHLYNVFCALFSLQSGSAGSLPESLDALESGLISDPLAIRSLAGLEFAAGNSQRARILEALEGTSEASANAKTKKLSDAAVEKMRSGDLKSAEKLLLEALAANPSYPEALMNLCSMRFMEGKKEQALKACQEAAGSVYAEPKNKRPGFVLLAREAELESYKILSALGRKAEAKKALHRAVENAPDSWPRLAEAKDALKR